MISFTSSYNFADDDCVIDVVTPQLLNAQLPVEKQKGSSSAAGNDAILAGGDFKNRTRFAPPAVEAGVEIQNQEAAMTQQKLVDINEVLEIMTGHASKLKRRSVQAEFCDVITHVKNRLNAPFCDAIQEEVDKQDQESRAENRKDGVAKR